MPLKEEKKNVKANAQKNNVNGLQVLIDECIWSKAGMVQSKLCDNVYDCRTCAFNITMKQTFSVDSKKQSSGWVNDVKYIYQWTKTPCRHALTGRVTAAKVCVNNYECNHCAYDQMLDDENMDFLDENPASLKGVTSHLNM